MDDDSDDFDGSDDDQQCCDVIGRGPASVEHVEANASIGVNIGMIHPGLNQHKHWDDTPCDKMCITMTDWNHLNIFTEHSSLYIVKFCQSKMNHLKTDTDLSTKVTVGGL